MNSWLVALRIARREARRAKGRSALVIALIGLPILALSFAAVTYDSFRLTPADEADRTLGRADALLRWEFDSPVWQLPDGVYGIPADGLPRPQETPVTDADLLAVLPPGSRVSPLVEGAVDLETPAGSGQMELRGVDLADDLARGLAVLRDGRAPTADDEVALTAQAAARLDVALGGTVRTADRSDTYTVVGMVEFPDRLYATIAFRLGGVPASAAIRNHHWLAATPAPVTWDQVKELNRHGITALSRAVLLDPPPPSQVELQGSDSDEPVLAVGALIAGLGLLEVVLLAGPAFAVGAKRRQRELALVAASGGTPRQLRRIVLADGVVLGAAGAVAGIVLGIIAAVAARPLLEEYLWQARAGGYRFFPLALLGVAGIAVLTGLLAALVPAFTAGRQSVLTALTGRKGAVRSRKRWLALGLVMTGLGAAVAGWGAWQISTTLMLGGLILAELGLVLCTPAIVGLVARLGSRLPLAPRIALRDTARNRAAAAPAISAVMAAVAGSLALGIVVDSDDARQRSGYVPALPPGSAAVSYEWHSGTIEDPGPHRLEPEHREAIRAAVSTTLPAARLFEVSAPACPTDSEADDCGAWAVRPPENECPAWERPGELSPEEQRATLADERCRYNERYLEFSMPGAVIHDGSDPALLKLLTRASDEDVAAAAAVLREGGVAVMDPLLVVAGSATMETWEVDYSATGDVPPSQIREVTVPAHAFTTGDHPEIIISPQVVEALGLSTEVVALVAETAVAPTQAEQDTINAVIRETNSNLGRLYVEDGPHVRNDPTVLILVAVAGVIALGAAGIATGLAAADRRPDLSTLAAIGASGRVRRLLALSQSGVIAGLGALLGIAAGAGAAVAVISAWNQAGAREWPPPTPYPITVSWSAVGLLLLVPLVAMASAGLLTRSRLPIERRTG